MSLEASPLHCMEEHFYQTTRSSLLARLKDLKDRESWLQFFELYWRLIYNVALRCGLSHEAAQDIVQETIIKVAENVDSFRKKPGRGRFKAWLRSIARSQIAMMWRRQKHRTDSRLLPDVDPELISAEAELEQVWDEEWNKNLIHSTLAKLKQTNRAKHYQIFHTFVIQGASAARVATMFGISTSYVYVIKHRLAKQFEAEMARLRDA